MESDMEIYICGIGHNTPVYIDLVEAIGYHIAGLYHYDDTRTGEIDHGYKILGSFDDLFRQGLNGKNFALSMGDNTIRAALYKRIVENGGNVPTLIHPSAQISRFAKLGNGVVFHMNVIVHPDVTIGDNSVVSFGSSVSHSSTVGSHCYIAANVLVGAFSNIADNVFIGLGATIVSGKVASIGANAIVGAGACVINSVPENTVVAGVPAREIKKITPPPSVTCIMLCKIGGYDAIPARLHDVVDAICKEISVYIDYYNNRRHYSSIGSLTPHTVS
jgi:UDP-perosamine 4-acetyltransferase